MAWIYILKSTIDGSYYVGSTVDINRRLCEHNRGQTLSTRAKAPYILVYQKATITYRDAHILELRIKKLKSKKILDIIVLNQTLTIR